MGIREFFTAKDTVNVDPTSDFRKRLPAITYCHGSVMNNSLIELQQLRYQVFCKELMTIPAGRFHSSLEEDEYDPISEHFMSRIGETLVSGVRLILPRSGVCFPFQETFNISPGTNLPNHLESAEISKWVTSKSYRRRSSDSLEGISLTDFRSQRGHGFTKNYTQNQLQVLSLFRAMYRFSKRNKIRYWYLSVNDLVCQSISQLGIPFLPVISNTYVDLYICDLSNLAKYLYNVDEEFADWFLS